MSTASGTERLSSYAAFWPYYISEHRSAKSRRLHFVGTLGFTVVLALSIATAPLHMAIALAVGAVALVVGFRMEARRSAAPVLLTVIVACAMVQPLVLLGVLWAYGFAWYGHFRIEHNRPATFVYPLWSLASDFRMVGLMCTGRLWTGDASELVPLAAE